MGFLFVGHFCSLEFFLLFGGELCFGDGDLCFASVFVGYFFGYF